MGYEYLSNTEIRQPGSFQFSQLSFSDALKHARSVADIKKEAAFRLRQIIDWLGMNKGEFADWIGEIGSSRLSGWTDGRYLPPIDYMLKLKHEKDISLDWLYAGDKRGQIPAITEKLESIEPTPLRLKPRKAKILSMATHPKKRGKK